MHDGKRTVTVKKEHIAVLKEPGSILTGHVSPPSGTAKEMSKSLCQFCSQESLNTDFLEVVGSDGTAVNTGPKGAVVRLMEETLNKPSQWAICQQHANELPLRHIFEQLDGPTSGPKGYTGPIGNALPKCEDQDVQRSGGS